MSQQSDRYNGIFERLILEGFSKPCMNVFKRYLLVRPDVQVATREMLMIFASGKISRLERLITALNRVDPAHPDLPAIYALRSDFRKPMRKPENICKKGKAPWLSVPLDEVPQEYITLLLKVKEGRTRGNYLDTVRRILGAARRASLPEKIDRLSIVALRRELSSGGPHSALLHMSNSRNLAKLLNLESVLITQLGVELKHFSQLAKEQGSQRKRAFMANPITPLNYAEQALACFEEATQSACNRQTLHRLFTIAALLSFLSYDPERLTDFGAFRLGKNIFLDAFGWHTDFLSSKTEVDRAVPYFPKVLNLFLNSLILLGADPSPDNLLSLYAQRAANHGPLFARIDGITAYQNTHLSALIKSRTGHGIHASRKAITDYIVKNGGSVQEVMDILGHQSPKTSKSSYEVFAPKYRCDNVCATLTAMREADAKSSPRRNPATYQLVDPKVIYGARGLKS